MKIWPRDWGPTIIALSSVLVQIPFLERGISYVDEGSIVTIAEEIRHGEVLYRDLATIISPLVYEITALLHVIWGPHLLVSRNFQLVIFTLCALLSYWILSPLVGRRWALFGSLALYPIKSLAFPLWTIVNYSQLAMLFTLATTCAVQQFLASYRLRWLFAAGLGIGLTFMTKQNIGGLLGIAVAATVVLDAWRAGHPIVRPAIARGFTLVGGTLPPIIAVVAYYAARGALFHFIDRAFIGLSAYAPEYAITLPGLALWWGRADLFGWVAFVYFPTALWHLSWEGIIEFRSLPVYVTCELIIRAVYFVPLICILWGAYDVWRSARRGEPRETWSPLVLIVAVAAVSYFSMLYRADWAHLMNVYPPLVLACVLTLARSADTRRRVYVAVGLLVLWFAVGATMMFAIVAIYREEIQTARGRLFAPPAEAHDTNKLLAHIAALPRDARVLFLRSEPLYYFFTDRRLPIPFDLYMPAYLRPGDDETVAAALSDVDEVIYNPKIMATIPGAITTYAPKTAAVLTRDFRVVETLGATSFVLRPARDGQRAETTVFDFWNNPGKLKPENRAPGGRIVPLPADLQNQVRPDDWMTYRVMTTIVRNRTAATCFTASHTVEASDAISAMPMLHPDRWVSGDTRVAPEESDLYAKGARFDVTVLPDQGEPAIIFTAERWPSEIPPWVRIELAPYAGQKVRLRFCTTAIPETPPGPSYVPAGWAETKIVRPSGR